MESTTTYTRRENARRAAVTLGIPRELVQITVHKSSGEVRFGWKMAAVPATKVVTKGATPRQPQKRPVGAYNGRQRPRTGGVCAAIWDWLDAHPNATVMEARIEGMARGWNQNNLTCEFYIWRKFNRIAQSGSN